MEKQITTHILMIEPVAFGYNAQTAVNNYFQQNDNTLEAHIQRQAKLEFDEMVAVLRQLGIVVEVIKDTVQPHTPDSIFPNNWISFHQDGTVVLYPMYAPNRRAERRTDIIDILRQRGYNIQKQIDLTYFETDNLFLEGTGSMLLDRVQKKVYAALSERTNNKVLREFCQQMNYLPIVFTSNQSVGDARLPIYHTNVLMCLAENYAVICLDTIDDEKERAEVVSALERSNRNIITISESQMQQFAGNMLQVVNAQGQRFLVLSQSAYGSLTELQINTLSIYNQLVPIAIPTIEKYGGGSVRCMMAELFNI